MNMRNGEVHNAPIARCYATQLLRLDSGRGATVRDAGGRRYLDFSAGIAVNALGHGRRDLARIAAREMRRRIHVSNLFTTEPTVRLAARLVESTIGDSARTEGTRAAGKHAGSRRAGEPGDPARAGTGVSEAGHFSAVFFGNSGTEANEAALKFARLYARTMRGAGNHRLVSFTGGFHGRSMGALSTTANAAYREPFEPLIGGVEYLPYNDIDALDALDSTVAGVIVEPIQGEGGLDALTPEFAQALNDRCGAHDIVLIADEIQSGMGRSGELYACDTVGLVPDIVTLSKPLAAGLPLSATLIPERINAMLKPGDHGSTFGGGPVTCAVAERVWDNVSAPSFLERVREAGLRLTAGLEELATAHPIASGGVKGSGLLCGLALEVDSGHAKEAVTAIMAAAREAGLLILRSGSNVLRIAPPLTIRKREIDRGLDLLDSALERVEAEHPEWLSTQAQESALEAREHAKAR